MLSLVLNTKRKNKRENWSNTPTHVAQPQRFHEGDISS